MSENRPIRVLMKSDKWVGVHLTIAPFDKMYLKEAPELSRVIDDQTASTDGLVIIDVYEFA
ncbi:hypothetical protein GCM10020216_016110 [Nonomuraea helvata]